MGHPYGIVSRRVGLCCCASSTRQKCARGGGTVGGSAAEHSKDVREGEDPFAVVGRSRGAGAIPRMPPGRVETAGGGRVEGSFEESVTQ